MPHSVSPIAALSSTNLTSQAPGNNESSRNDTESIFGHQEILSVTMIVLLAIICLLIVLVNGLVVFLICRNRTLKSVTNMFLTSLALSDLISGLVGFPLFASCLRSGVLNVCVSSTIFFRFTAISSVCHVLLVATDRYVAIVHPLQHDSVVTKWRAIGATTFVWIFAFSSSVVQLSWFGLDENSLFDFEATEDLNLTYSKTCIVLFFAFPLILMCCIYGRIFYISYKLTKSDRELTDVWKVQESRSVLYEWRGRSVLLIMMVIFVGCWLPFFLAMIDDHMNPTESSPPIWVQRLLVVLNFIPPLFNPLLCTLAKKDFRKALLGVIYKSNELRLNLEWRSTATGSV
ncbi:histamine H2 receptor-like [Montipora capricornis]|uniref:histamine H2 receptor-like n=1 Tax=Montipora capricornis TaxID=246305 RepID=UPI0035F19298